MQQKHTKALSICHHMKSTESTMRAHIYFYGYSSQNPDTWVSHVFSYLEHLQGITGPCIKTYRLCFHFPVEISVEKVDAVLEPLLGPREKTSPPWNVSCMVLKRSRYPIPPVKWVVGSAKLQVHYFILDLYASTCMKGIHLFKKMYVIVFPISPNMV